MGNAPQAATAGHKFISDTRHGGKSTRMEYPLTGPGRGQGINLETMIGLAQKVYWVISNYSVQQIQAYLQTYPQDVSMVVWWTALNSDISGI